MYPKSQAVPTIGITSALISHLCVLKGNVIFNSNNQLTNISFFTYKKKSSPKGHARELTHSYWGIQVNPKVTPEIIKEIPKADLNCRLGKSFLKCVAVCV